MRMRSFTSASKRVGAASYASAVLLAGCATICATAELVVRFNLDAVSKIQRRTAAEYRLATSATTPAARHIALFLGNSLLDEGVRFDTVKSRLAPDWEARRFVVEQTAYHDWYYALRRLFADGARADTIVIMMSPLHWIHDGMRGDYSAYYLMTDSDAVMYATRMHPTAGTGFMLAAVSNFWGARVEIRNFVLGRILPRFGELMSATSIVDRSILKDDDVERIATGRLEDLRVLAAAYDARLVVMVPPVIEPNDGSEGLARAARRTGLAVFAPVRSGTYPASLYRDGGFHLNAIGATRFTDELLDPLRAVLDQTIVQAPSAQETARLP